MRSSWEFVTIALAVTVTPGPATATILRVAGRDGRRAATAAIFGNSLGVFLWGALAAVGVSQLILASQIAFDALRVGGAIVLVTLGARSLVGRSGPHTTLADPSRQGASGWRTGLVSSVSNPKLATFFVALFPQFLRPGTDVLPVALAMAGTIVLFDLVWYSTLAFAVDRAVTVLRPGIRRRLEAASGAVMVALGIRLATEAR